MAFSVGDYFDAHTRLASRCDPRVFEAGINLIRSTFDADRQIITCGNGGSSYAASHYVMEWNKVISSATGRKFRGISLCDNVGLITAYSNDQSFSEIFSGQLKAILNPGDLLIAISGSGNSQNVIKAVEFANQTGAETLAVVGYDGGQLMRVARQSVWIPSFDMQLCEEVHLMFGHMVMKALAGETIRE
jgi:D-sedoheptulose 7-phosphate isomerase